MPAIRRASRLPVAEALQATGSAVGGQGRLDALLRRVTFLPRSAQIGLRGVARRKRRTLATALQVALSVGALLALLALGTSVGNSTREYFDDWHFDVFTGTVATRPFNPEATRVLAIHPRCPAHPAAAEHERQGRRQGRHGVGHARTAR